MPPTKQTESTLPAIAVFDFDGTLTKYDSFLPFFCWAVGWGRYLWGLLILSQVLVKLALKLIPNWQAKETFLTYFLSGWSEEKLLKSAQSFAVKKIPNMVRPEAIKRLQWHQEQEHQIVIVSASPQVYLIPWGQIMGIEQVLGTQLEVQSGIVTGRILGKNCYGKEKVERLKALLGDMSGYCLYAYGDSSGDKELLAAAKYAYYRKFEDVSELEHDPSKKVEN